MVVSWSFNVDAFIDSWSDFENSRPFPAFVRETSAERIGVATLALVSSRREYWIALGLITGYAEENQQTLRQVVDSVTSTGEIVSSGTRRILSWAIEQPFAQQLGNVETVMSAIYSVGAALRPEAIEAAAVSGASWEACWERYKPDLSRAWACYLGQ
jgi:hypothetical protein